MNIKDLLFSEAVADKLWYKHNVTVDEVYELFLNDEDSLIIRRSQSVKGTYVAYGRTYAGRYLMAAFRLLEQGVAKIITSRDMDVAERRLYREAVDG